MAKNFKSRVGGYNRRRTVKADGHTFDSRGEYERYKELKWLEKLKKIKTLEVKPRLSLVVNGQDITKRPFRPDFIYFEGEKTVIEDYKGNPKWIDREFKIKWKLAQAIYPTIEFRLVTNGGVPIDED